MARNWDEELINVVKQGEPLTPHITDGAVVKAETISKLLINDRVPAVRLHNTRILGQIDLQNAANNASASIGALELRTCVIEELINLSNTRLARLCLFNCAVTEIRASDSYIYGPVDISGLHSAQQMQGFQTVRVARESIKKGNAPRLSRKRSGPKAPDEWWTHKVATNITDKDTEKEPDTGGWKTQGVCMVDFSNGIIEGNFLSEGARLVEREVVEDKSRNRVEGPALDLANTEIRGDIFFEKFRSHEDTKIAQSSTTILGRLRMRNLHLRGDIWASGMIVWAMKDYAITLQSATIEGNIMLRGMVFEDREEKEKREETKLAFVARGCCNLLGADINGSMELHGSHFYSDQASLYPEKDSSSSWALTLDKARIGSVTNDMSFPSKISGNVSFYHCEVKSSLIWQAVDMSGIDDSSNCFIQGAGLRVSGDFDFSPKARLGEYGEIYFIGARIDGNMYFNPTLEGKAVCEGIHIGGDLSLEGAIIKGQADFTNARIGGDLNFSQNREQTRLWKSITFIETRSKRRTRPKIRALITHSRWWEKLRDLEAKQLNEASGLVLRGATIGETLRIHRLQVHREPRDEETNQFRESVLSYVMNWIISYLKSKSAVLKRGLGGGVNIKTARSIGLSFYPGWQWVEVRIEKGKKRYGFVSVLWNKEKKEAKLLNGTSSIIHEHNATQALDLNTPDKAKDYLRFFCRNVWGEEGPFTLYEHADSIDPKELQEQAQSISISNTTQIKDPENEKEGHWLATAHVRYSNALFEAKFKILDSGMVEMLDDRPLLTDQMPSMIFQAPYYYPKNLASDDNWPELPLAIIGTKKWTLIEGGEFGKLKKALSDNHESEISYPPLQGHVSTLTQNLKNLLVKWKNKFQESEFIPKFFKVCISFLYKILLRATKLFVKFFNNILLILIFAFRLIGQFCKEYYIATKKNILLDRIIPWIHSYQVRFHLAPTIENLPVIDLRGLTVETLDDDRGRGWRDWSDEKFRIYARLEGFEYRRIKYIQIVENLRKDDNFSKKFGKAVTGSIRDDRYDNHWRDRIEWLNRQYVRGYPARRTYNSQPWSHLTRVYRNRGDFINADGIAEEKSRIEFGLVARALELRWIVYGALIALFLFMADQWIDWNSELTILAIFTAIIGALPIKSAKSIYILFLLIGLPCLWFWEIVFPWDLPFGMTSLQVVQWFLTGVAIIAMFSRFMFGLLIKIFSLTSRYALSPTRVLITMIVSLAVGTWAVENIKDDYLVVDAEYSSTVLNQDNEFSIPIDSNAESNISCGDTINSLVYAADVFFPLIDLRQDFRCHVRTSSKDDDYRRAEAWKLWSFSERSKEDWSLTSSIQQFWRAMILHPDTWQWLRLLYAISGWIFVSIAIITATRVLRHHSGDGM